MASTGPGDGEEWASAAIVMKRAQLQKAANVEAAEQLEEDVKELQAQIESLRAQLNSAANERTDLQTQLAGTLFA